LLMSWLPKEVRNVLGYIVSIGCIPFATDGAGHFLPDPQWPVRLAQGVMQYRYELVRMTEMTRRAISRYGCFSRMTRRYFQGGQSVRRGQACYPSADNDNVYSAPPVAGVILGVQAAKTHAAHHPCRCPDSGYQSAANPVSLFSRAQCSPAARSRCHRNIH